MTIEERNIKLKHLITCMKCELSGKVCDANCPTQYEAGHVGEVIENLEAISEALEQQPCEKAISRKIDEFKVKGKTAEVWIVKGKLQIRCLGVIHNLPLPSVTPKEKTGKWKVQHTNLSHLPSDTIVTCLECGHTKSRIDGEILNFCPKCGARMVSE